MVRLLIVLCHLDSQIPWGLSLLLKRSFVCIRFMRQILDKPRVHLSFVICCTCLLLKTQKGKDPVWKVCVTLPLFCRHVFANNKLVRAFAAIFRQFDGHSVWNELMVKCRFSEVFLSTFCHLLLYNFDFQIPGILHRLFFLLLYIKDLYKH